MKKIRITCETCQFRGYSLDFCKLHQKKIAEVTDENCQPYYREMCKKVGKTAALGAGVGVLATTVGIAVVPAIGLKAIIGHTLVAKLTAGGGAAGAGVNVARQSKKIDSKSNPKRKRKVLLPLYLKKGS